MTKQHSGKWLETSTTNIGKLLDRGVFHRISFVCGPALVPQPTSSSSLGARTLWPHVNLHQVPRPLHGLFQQWCSRRRSAPGGFVQLQGVGRRGLEQVLRDPCRSLAEAPQRLLAKAAEGELQLVPWRESGVQPSSPLVRVVEWWFCTVCETSTFVEVFSPTAVANSSSGVAWGKFRRPRKRFCGGFPQHLSPSLVPSSVILGQIPLAS